MQCWLRSLIGRDNVAITSWERGWGGAQNAVPISNSVLDEQSWKLEDKPGLPFFQSSLAEGFAIFDDEKCRAYV